MIIGIIGAMEEEVAVLKEEMDVQEVVKAASMDFCKGVLLSLIHILSKGICLCFLAICSWQDIKKREISVSFLRVGSLLGIISFICSGREYWYLYFSGAGIGIVFLIISKVTEEAIGYGDGWIVCIMGSFLGIWSLLEALAVSYTHLDVYKRQEWS